MTRNNDLTPLEEELNHKNLFNRLAVFPAVNIADTNETIYIVVEVPGFRYEDISVRVMGSCLFVSGSRNESYSDKTKLHIQTERIASFRWVYDLKMEVLKKDLLISLENGFLCITVVKPEIFSSSLTEDVTLENYTSKNIGFPRANIVETENHIELSLEIPGYKNGDVSIKVINSSLNIKGKRALELPDEKAKYRRIEIPFSNSFSRKFDLPDNVNQSQASWNVQFGVLFIYLPKLKKIRRSFKRIHDSLITW